ncbi:MAG: hypothetical protein NTV01_01345 [Bacteroidia bacterium]|nr:hypothetical protein [Bacteroidia bacterium]
MLVLFFVLAMLNVFVIGAFVWKSILPPQKPGPAASSDNRDVSAILEKELGLSREQVQQIKYLRAEFVEKEQKLIAAIRMQRDSMNAEMFNKVTSEEVIHSLAGKIAENEYGIELLRYEQAKRLKSVCTPGQVEKFERLVREMRDYLRPDSNPEKGKRRGPPKRMDENR